MPAIPGSDFHDVAHVERELMKPYDWLRTPIIAQVLAGMSIPYLLERLQMEQDWWQARAGPADEQEHV